MKRLAVPFFLAALAVAAMLGAPGKHAASAAVPQPVPSVSPMASATPTMMPSMSPP
jgi:hypothetical protein